MKLSRKQAILAIFGAVASEASAQDSFTAATAGAGTLAALTRIANFGFGFQDFVEKIHFEWRGRRAEFTMEEIFEALETKQ